MSDVVFPISGFGGKAPELRKAEVDTNYSDTLDTPDEKLAAAKIICGKVYTEKELDSAEACLKAALNIQDKKLDGSEVEGADMVGSEKFSLVAGKIYGWGGAQVAVKDNKFRVTYDATVDSGAVHDYESNPSWNGNPIDITPYSKLIVVVEGDASNTKFELNNTVAFSAGELKAGENVVDLAARKKDDFDPLTHIKKINFVNNPGKGQYVIRLILQ